MEEKNQPLIKILVACHKADPNIRQDGMYMPIHVGKALHSTHCLDFQGDNTGENISLKNRAYSEVTAIFWGWKNLRDIDYIGLCHYRRYFDISEKQIRKILASGAVIIPREHTSPHSNLTNLAGLLTLEEAYITIDTVLDLFPEMNEAVVRYFYNSNKYSVFNMFIMPWSLFDEYCTFLFAILDALELKLKPNQYSRHCRNMGYIAEALFGLWITYKKIRVKRIGVTQSDSQSQNYIKKKALTILSELSYRLIHPFPTKEARIYTAAVALGLKNDGIELKHLKQ